MYSSITLHLNCILSPKHLRTGSAYSIRAHGHSFYAIKLVSDSLREKIVRNYTIKTKKIICNEFFLIYF
jgi:hypothetical protein